MIEEKAVYENIYEYFGYTWNPHEFFIILVTTIIIIKYSRKYYDYY